ncbi:sigma-70 family RNA polymerase sigma factor [Bacillus sp. KH172YL63]|uniref:sigma-70 family RNA polymerase sigma factor n=1 Tax=Bacillus sp. KH172YL63 TaxID=2709784 RepID=UPI0013E4D583|nr:sigma-70 family RNA polymerase sigma factor [Bacillus sp. KH172YL63]BCB02549.1 RNA polymerase subunit sigma [Bacillus sp. KH172YL63]
MEELSRTKFEEAAVTIEDVVDQYGEDVWKLVFSYVRHEQTADDLTQEIFIKIYKKIDTFAGHSTMRTWIWRVAINHCKDYLNSWYKRRVSPEEDRRFERMRSTSCVEGDVVQRDEDRELEAVVMGLPLKYREIIYLYYYEECPIKEVSSLLGVKENTVKTRLRKAKQLMKERLVNG